MVTGSRMLVALAATVVVAALVVAAAGAVIAGRARDEGATATSSSSARQAPAWTPGACVIESGSRFDLTACNGGHAEVLAMESDPLDCPADTDEIARVGKRAIACLQYFVEPHPGARGAGGGLLRAGDCLDRAGRELPCATPGWYGMTVAVVTRMADCPRGTVDALAMEGQVACLASGGGVLAEGACVDEKVRRVACGSGRAWARVTAFGRSGRDCPQGSDRFVTARGAFRPVTCLHLVAG
ncbi:hypothetical protein ACFXJ8_06235 [Nonomuraea sp. NPDC059194]|uniref:hypothetical protein n=1 Tax=Nonomuraea sp. NPDC059194 TaxID=3346764 RepID=UPI0036C3550B